MKKLFLAALAVTIGFASCSKDPGVETSDDGYVSISLNFAENFTKGVMDDINTDEIQDAVTVTGNVYVFIAQDGALLVKEPVALTSISSTPFTHKTDGEETDANRLTKDIDQIIIIGNAPSTFSASSLNTVADLEKAYFTLADAQTDYKTTPKIWVQGQAVKSDIQWADTPGTDAGGTTVTNGTVTIDLHPVLSRMDVTVDLGGVSDGIFATTTALEANRQAKEEGDPNKQKGGIVIQSVSVLFSASQSALVDPYTPSSVANETAAQAAFFSGINITDSDYAGWNSGAHGYSSLFGATDKAETFLFANWLGNGWYDSNPNNTGGTTNYVEKTTPDLTGINQGEFKRTFYAFSPKYYTGTLGSTTDYEMYTIITIHAKQYKLNESGEVTTDVINRFFSMTFDGLKETGGDTTEELQPGARYEVNLKLTGDFSDGGGGGTSPEDKGYANLKITVNPAKWKVTTPVEKEFGN